MLIGKLLTDGVIWGPRSYNIERKARYTVQRMAATQEDETGLHSD